MEELDTARGEEALEPASMLRAGAQDAHYGEPSARFQDPVGLPQGTCRVAELVEGAAADGPLERGVEERKVLRARRSGCGCRDPRSSPGRGSGRRRRGGRD